MLDNSGVEYTSEYFNQTIPLGTSINPSQKSESIKKVESLLEKLKKAQEINLSMQNDLINTINESHNKMLTLENMLNKVNMIKKSKPKKHLKYPNYIPLDCFYYYTPKRTHLYYHLLEKVFESSKKDPDKDDNMINNVEEKIKSNRFNFNGENDKMLNNILYSNEKNNIIDWYKVSAEMNKRFNSTNKNHLLEEKNNDINTSSILKEEDSDINIKKNTKKNNNNKKIQTNNNENKITIFTPLICYVRYLETSSFYKYKKWNKDEDQILRRAILYYGPKNWQQISYCLNGRNNSQCFHRWMKGINPKIRRDKWSFEEDLTLGIALNMIYQKKKWSKIANHLLGRTDIQCRERWCNILDPSLEEVEWTNEEDLKLLNLFRKYGNKWSLIAKHYGNRTDNTCWRRWKYLTCINFSKSSNEGFTSNINDISGMSKFVVNKDNNSEINSSQISEFNDISKKKLFRVVNFGRK